MPVPPRKSMSVIACSFLQVLRVLVGLHERAHPYLGYFRGARQAQRCQEHLRDVAWLHQQLGCVGSPLELEDARLSLGGRASEVDGEDADAVGINLHAQSVRDRPEGVLSRRELA